MVYLYIHSYSYSNEALLSDEHNCGNPLLLIEENGGLLDILLLIAFVTSVLLVVIACGVKNYKNQIRIESHHSVILSSRRPLPPISSDLLPTCPPQTPLLPPPYTIENLTHYIEQDATKPPACDLITHSSE